MVILMVANIVQADVCGFINGGFEDDGEIDPLTEVNEPNGWDVNMPADKFGGYVKSVFVTDGGEYNPTLYSKYGPGVTFYVDDMTTVSQDVNLTDANEIFFDFPIEQASYIEYSVARIN